MLVKLVSDGFKFTSPILNLFYLENTGAAFNILKDAREALIIASASAITLVFVYVFKHLKRLSGSTLFWVSMLCSGIFCNMHERIAIGCVRDFFQLPFVNFPIFNISDIMITLSVTALIIIILFKRSRW